MNHLWMRKKIGEICEIQNGFAFKSSDYTDDGYRVIRIGNVQNGKVVDKKPKYIPSGLINSFREFVLDNDDILISLTGDVGRVGQIKNELLPAVLNQRVGRVKGINQNLIDRDFLFRFLDSKGFEDLVIESAQGVAQKNTSTRKIKDIYLPIPPLPEQKRIVAKLDQAFEAIDKAKANVERNLQNAKDLFQSQLNENFSQKRDGWENVKLSELATDITDGDHMPPPKTKEGVPFITISNINKENHQIDFTNTFTVSDEYYQKLKEKRKPQKGDVLYTVTGSFGIPVVIEHDFKFCFQRHIGLIRPKKDLNSEWLYYWILSPQAILQANDTATGTAQRTVSLTALRNFTIPRIPLKEQQIIVQELNTLSTEVRKLEYNYLQNIFDLDELKKSILQKAFNGEL